MRHSSSRRDGEAAALAVGSARTRARWAQPTSQFALGGVDDGSRKRGLGDQSEDLRLEGIGRRPARSAAKLRAAVVTAVCASLDVGLAANARPAGTDQQSPEGVGPERLRLVAGSATGRYGGASPLVVGNREDWLMLARALIAAALLDDVAEVDTPSPVDLLDGFAGPLR